jgi:hypothetical protein
MSGNSNKEFQYMRVQVLERTDAYIDLQWKKAGILGNKV